ncbi:hypothetical protein BDK51DRAFT_40629 [Blyttiomyces helicus]|uniref:Uncharacterized protein n=1 Tax=Blyttiomyces helicus TaxID=388810 RepID=A0A4P9WEC8_9FUNG|nr:hypothetical protein BDK51DRAFT_40629 [Blyttiomyces helicus]|eukprot:RKO88736.1 hypothetical protein BDK51DRAFT_40629 [Blyttiomyces helicus]
MSSSRAIQQRGPVCSASTQHFRIFLSAATPLFFALATGTTLRQGSTISPLFEDQGDSLGSAWEGGKLPGSARGRVERRVPLRNEGNSLNQPAGHVRGKLAQSARVQVEGRVWLETGGNPLHQPDGHTRGRLPRSARLQIERRTQLENKGNSINQLLRQVLGKLPQSARVPIESMIKQQN